MDFDVISLTVFYNIINDMTIYISNSDINENHIIKIKKQIIQICKKFNDFKVEKINNTINSDKKIINDFLNKTDIKVIDNCTGCHAQYSWGRKIIEFYKQEMMTKEKHEIENKINNPFNLITVVKIIKRSHIHAGRKLSL